MVEGDLSRRVSRIHLTLVVAALACAWVLLGSPVNADAAGSFTCRAMGTTKAANTVANPAVDPCVNDTARPITEDTFFGVYIPPGTPDCTPVCRGEPYGYYVHVGYTDAYTYGYYGTAGSAYASVGDIYIYPMDVGNPIPNPVEIEIQAGHAEAHVDCGYPRGSTQRLQASGSVAYTYSHGVQQQTSDPIDINLTPAYLGVLHLNWQGTISTGGRTEIVRRAVWWDIPGNNTGEDFIAGEARAGFSGNPCV